MTADYLAGVLKDERDDAESETLYRETLDVQRRVLGPESSETADTAYNLACLMAVRGRREEAISFLREAVDHGLSPSADLDIEKDAELRSLHGDPRFSALVAHAKERAVASPTHQSS